eukprot:TRINITY_DN18544_c0_g1_i1.p1 TRINITY_DN18544_c0_g1~~TRINITY_DN18544_c0_g1_i1.p1  ORF type:complete len:352 (-),score=46.03 TRINITY_DN18544_c0_g1_i1:236-1291(-)
MVMLSLQRRAIFGYALMHVLVPVSATAPRLRERLLCEAQTRIMNWYHGGEEALEAPKEQDGVSLRLTVDHKPCGGDNIPVTFGEFEIIGVRPVDVFNVLADTAYETQWNSVIGTSAVLGTFPDQGAVGVQETYPTGIPFVKAREVFEWQVYNASFSNENFWVAFSTDDNQALHEKSPKKYDTVEVQNCLGAYHLRPSAQGSHVAFTQQLNSHPFLVNSKVVFEMSWRKQISFINSLRKRAAAQAKQGLGKMETGLPATLLEDNPGIGSCDSLGSPGQLFDKVSVSLARSRLHWLPSAQQTCIVSALAAVFAAMTLAVVATRASTRATCDAEEEDALVPVGVPIHAACRSGH